jgi:hypothetical protein
MDCSKKMSLKDGEKNKHQAVHVFFSKDEYLGLNGPKKVILYVSLPQKTLVFSKDEYLGHKGPKKVILYVLLPQKALTASKFTGTKLHILIAI